MPLPAFDPSDPLRALREFVQAMTRLVDQNPDEPTLLERGRGELATLIADDRWLPESCATAPPGVYRQYLLHCDPLERFSVVSFCWGPGARTPIHNHTVWGLVGVLRGAERCHEFAPAGEAVKDLGQDHRMTPGMIEAVSPRLGDWHVVANDDPSMTSVSIHVYGGNIGAIRRHRVDPESGAIIDFVSGYSALTVPNLWDRSAVAQPVAAA